jgi:hypothetical protein
MPPYQTTPQNLAAVHLGSGKIELGTGIPDLQNLGLMTNINFKEDFKPIELKPDNSIKLIRGVNEHIVKLSFEMWELDVTKLALLRGGLDSTGSQASTPVTVTDELVTLTGTKLARLANRSGDGSEPTTITVKDSVNTSTVRNTDFVIGVDSAGWPVIGRVAASSVIADGETVKVSYTYTPSANKTMSTGGLNVLNGRYVRITNVNSAGKKFQIDIYNARVTGGLDISYPADDEGKALMPKIEMEGIYDISRTAGDQLYKITDEQGV